MKSFLRTDRRHRHPSLFGELVDWLLAPFLILWPISMALEYWLAFSVASAAYDRELKDSVVALSRQVAWRDGRLAVDMPPSALAMLRARGAEDSYFQVRGMANDVVAGHDGIPAVDFGADGEPQKVYFRDDSADGRDVRVAYMFAQVYGMRGAALVQVAESDDKRIQLANDILGSVFAAQLVILPVALLLIWFGLSRGLLPLDDIREKIRGRKPEDLSPIEAADAPEEIRPVIVAINDLMHRLESSLKAQQRFVADAAHQMRTPLAGLKTQAELALRQRDANGIEHTMRQIAAGADRASRLINQLLALARADSDAPPPLERVDLETLAREATRDWVPQALEKGIDLGFEGSGAPRHVEGNAILLRELLTNLIDNAIRYTERGGRVTVRLAAGDRVAVEVEDNGIGIAPEERELVFERFYRVLGTDGEGSGLGLAIVREIVDLHGAAIALEGNPRERGTVLTVTFPRSRAVARPLRPAA